MNGMAQDSWPYVIAAYVVTWVVLGGYALYLWRTVKDAFATSAHASDSSSR
jgi:CcmD family protein